MMDSFFAKKGITLSRPVSQTPQQPKQQIPRSSQQFPRTHAPNMSYSPFIKMNANPTTTNAQTPQINFGPRHQKTHSLEGLARNGQQFSKEHYPSVHAPTHFKQVSFLHGSKQENRIEQKPTAVNESFTQLQNQYPSSSSTEAQTHKSTHINPPNVETSIVFNNQESQKSVLNLRNKYREAKQRSLQNISPPKSMAGSEESRNLKADLEQALLRERVRDETIRALEQEREDLQKQLRESKQVPGFWIDDKIKLTGELQEKKSMIKVLESKMQEAEREKQTKIYMLQYEVRKLEGTKKRSQVQNENARLLLEMQRNKNDKAQQRMNKLMFFQDDLIHARDYHKLKKQMDEVLNQSARMFQQHQKFILQVGQSRRKLIDRLEEVEADLSRLRGEACQWRSKVEKLSFGSDDKRELIKLQHQINFLIKKNEQSMELVMNREKDLDQAHRQIKELTQNQNKRLQSNQNILDGLSLQQFTDTISLYESRLSDLSKIVQEKQIEIQKQKRTIQCLTTELRKSREDKHINNLKERSSQNTLKNEVIALQQSLYSEIDISKKKIVTLQSNIERKTKQISSKDKFIQQFLLTRAKLIEEGSLQQILESVQQYFKVPEPVEPQGGGETVAVDV